MKLKMNKACDLNSISVLPPQSRSRRLSYMQAGQQASQHRSQPSQQSFSQGISSQPPMFSQLSQSSLDDLLTSDQRFCSQERENSVKKALPLMSYSREESQMPLSRTSSSGIRKWNPASVLDRQVVNEELEHRIGMMETSLNRIGMMETSLNKFGMMETSLNKFGMILDSIQSDIMQVNKGTKEASLETDSIRQKLTDLDISLKELKKGQEDVKYGIDESRKSLCDQMNKDMYQDKFQQIFLMLSALPQQIEAYIQRLKDELRMTFTKDVQAMACNLKTTNQKSPPVALLVPKVSSGGAASLRRPETFNIPAMPSKACGKSALVPKLELGGCVSSRVEQAKSNGMPPQKEQERKRVSSTQQERQCIVVLDSDEEIDTVFSCFPDNDTGIKNYLLDEVDEETERILRKARRRQRRKCCNSLIVS